jgi:hypothetical protein
MFLLIYHFFMRESLYLKTAFVLLFFLMEVLQLQAFQFLVLLFFLKEAGNDLMKNNRLLLLCRITNAEVSRVRLAFDLLHVLGLNSWLLLSTGLFHFAGVATGGKTMPYPWLLINSLFFASLLMNTLLAHSDLHTMKGSYLKKVITSTLFGIPVSCVYLIFQVFANPYLLSAVLLLLIGSWYATVRRYTFLTYFKHYFRLS